MKSRDTLMIAALGGVLVYLLYRTTTAAARALASAGEALGSGLFDLFHPDPVGEVLYYSVKFPDGSTHAVPSRSVTSAGRFVNRNLSPNYPGDGLTYQLFVDKGVASGINKTAFPV
jgi:hypothetical protein